MDKSYGSRADKNAMVRYLTPQVGGWPALARWDQCESALSLVGLEGIAGFRTAVTWSREDAEKLGCRRLGIMAPGFHLELLIGQNSIRDDRT